MGLETKLTQKLSQSLLMTPQLQQAIKLLQLGRYDFLETLERELLENPLLEVSSDTTESSSEESASSNEPSEKLKENTVSEWESYIEQFHESRNSYSEAGSRGSFEDQLTIPSSLEEDLVDQIRFISLSDLEREALLYLIGNLDRRGYLQVSLEEATKVLGCAFGVLEEAHQILTSLDPIGVGCRSLAECLSIQLEWRGLGESLAGKIVGAYFDLLKDAQYSKLAKKLNTSVDEIKEAIAYINQLDPYPTRQYLDEAVRYVIPDVYIQRVGDDYQVLLNEEGIPSIRISNFYTSLLKRDKTSGSRDYLNQMLKSASWLIRSIEQRQRTILRVTESIVKFQGDFLDKGTQFLKPLVLKEVADDIEMHESTVSRITNNKFVHTPQGIFELKYFFSSGIKTAYGLISSSAIKDKIRNIINSEEPKRPVSDQRIVEMLKDEKIDIARRTVAKYRESLGIASSSKRKRLNS